MVQGVSLHIWLPGDVEALLQGPRKQEDLLSCGALANGRLSLDMTDGIWEGFRAVSRPA